MHRLGRNDVLISPVELTQLNPRISDSYIFVAMSRFNSGSSETWQNQPKPGDERKRLIHYSSIPDNFKSKHNLPTTEELISRIITNAAIEAADQKQISIELKDDALYGSLKQAAESDFVKFCPQYAKHFPTQNDKAITYAKTHAVLLACTTLKANYKFSDLHKAYLQTKDIKQSLKSLAKFRQMVNKYAKDGIWLVDKRAGKKPQHLVKITDFHIGVMEKYRMHPNHYTYDMITMLVNKDCTDAGLKPISVESVSQYLRQPEVKNRLSMYFNKRHYRNEVKAFTRRRSADFAGDEYYCDGSPLQMECWNKAHTKVIRLSLFVVMDLHSKKIVGFDLAESEDRYNWFSAFKMAFHIEGLLPYNMVFDNGSATKTGEFKTLQQELLLKGCHLNPTKAGNPQAKSQVERWFETFQSGFQRMIDGYMGEGIMSKRDNGRIDREFLTKVHKVNGYHSFNTMQSIITELIGIYNEKPVKKRKAANQVFRESEKPNVQRIGVQDIAFLFWMQKTIKVSRGEIKFDLRSNTYFYEVFDNRLALKINGQQVKVYYDERDLSTIQIFSLENEYLGELRQKLSIVAAKANQTDKDVLDIMKQSAHNNSMATTIEIDTKKIAAKAEAVNEDMFGRMISPFETSKEDFNSAETQLLRNYIREQNGVDESLVAEYQPVITESIQQDAETVQERHSKKFIKPASLRVISR